MNSAPTHSDLPVSEEPRVARSVAGPESGVLPLPRHFYSLDIVRGLAALVIVFRHWENFVSLDAGTVAQVHSRLPLYELLRPLYREGGRAVFVFFCLSGFIFFWLYADSIRKGATSVKEFVVLRFSRLYPLHFATLIFVAIGQQYMHWRFGSDFVYHHNDLYHFGLHLFFASNWGLQAEHSFHGYSFNGPVWSVSIEILLYAIFFVVCRLDLRRWQHVALYACVGLVLDQVFTGEIGRSVFSFFLGGLAYLAFIRLWRAGVTRRTTVLYTLLTIALWIFLPLNANHKILVQYYQSQSWTKALHFHGRDIIGYALAQGAFLVYEPMFAVTILTLALWEARRGSLGRRLSFLGDISYSTYLLHFPLQMVFLAVVYAITGGNAFFSSPWSLALFFATLIPLSLLSYRCFERPWQSFLRKRLLPKKAAATVIAGASVGD